MKVADVDECCNDAKTISTEKYLEMHKCDWCQQEFDGSDNAKFCSDVCKRKIDEFLVQSNCEWCYEKIQNRFGDKYCSLDCKEKDFNFLQLQGKRKIVVRILFALGILPASLLTFLSTYLTEQLGWFPQFYDSKTNIVTSVILGIFLTFCSYKMFTEPYLALDRRVHSQGLRKYFGYSCMHISIRGNRGYYRKSYVTDYCCPGCKYSAISSYETSFRSTYPFLVTLWGLFILFPVGQGIMKPVFEHMITINNYKWLIMVEMILLAIICLAICWFLLVRLYVKEQNRTRALYGMNEADYDALNKACEIIRREAESLPREAEINLKESVFTKSKSTLLEEAKSIAVSYYEDNKEQEILCRSMQDKFQKDVTFSVSNVTRKKLGEYDVEITVVNDSDININTCEINVCGKGKCMHDIKPGNTTTNVFKTNTSRVKLSNPELVSFIHERDGKPNVISITTILKPDYDKFLKLIGHTRQIPI